MEGLPGTGKMTSKSSEARCIMLFDIADDEKQAVKVPNTKVLDGRRRRSKTMTITTRTEEGGGEGQGTAGDKDKHDVAE